MKKLLITGHLGLIGSHTSPLLTAQGYQLVGIDLKDNSGDITDSEALAKAIEGCHGIIHLAAVSRVLWGQKDPDLCWKTNALASENLLKIAANSTIKPWVIVGSSREVYGEQTSDKPIHEDVTPTPVNIYGESKLAMEQFALKARETGLNTAILRFANVYGSTQDHPDRVLPAFCHNAVTGEDLRVDGFDHLFDFTHIDDTADGVARLVALLDSGAENIPPIHFLTGIGTTLQQAAQLAVAAANSQSRIVENASRDYDVSRFVGDTTRAKEILDWQATTSVETGIKCLVKDFRSELS